MKNKSEGFISNIQNTDLSACDESDSFLQSAMWGRFKSRFGWEARAFSAEWAGGGVRPLLTLCRKIAPGIVMCYIPWGPQLPGIFAGDKTDVLTELALALKPFLPRNATFIRFDPPWLSVKSGSDDNTPDLSAPFRRSAADIQPPDTVLIDLTLSHNDILNAMKPKWRYNTGLAEKRGVVVSRNDGKDIDIFYQLLTETAERDGISIHSIDYYRTLFAECSGDSTMNLHLYTAKHEDDVLAAIVVLCRGKQATYLYGASSNVKRNLMAPYALQWKAMQDAKAYGCTQYDLFGIPPDDDPAHPMAGLYRFKTGFGGTIIHRPGSWDYPYNPILYALFTFAEKLRKKLMNRHKRHLG